MNVENPVVVVTGASSGTGAAAARQLRSGGAEVVVVGRDPTRTHALADELGVRGVTADFTSLASVRRLAEDLLAVNPASTSCSTTRGLRCRRAVLPWTATSRTIRSTPWPRSC